MSFEGYCHLAKVSACPDPCQRIGKRTPRCAVHAQIHHPDQYTVLTVYPVAIVHVYFCLRNLKGKYSSPIAVILLKQNASEM